MRRRIRKIALLLLGLLLLAVAGGLLYMRTEHFRRTLQARIVRQLAQITGGRVEIGAMTISLRPLEARLEGLVIRGQETDVTRPFLAAETVLIDVKIISLWKRDIDWRLVRVTRPRINISVDAQGRSNIPRPGARARGAGPLDEVFNLAIKRLEVSRGEFAWNDRRVPLDFTAGNIAASLLSDPARGVYHGRLVFDTNVARLWPGPSPDARRAAQLHGKIEADLVLSRAAVEITRMTLATARSTAETSGTLVNFARPKLTLNYKARLDSAEVALATDHPELRAGQARVQGKLSYDSPAKTFETAGDLRLDNVAINRPHIEIAGISGTSSFRAVRGRLEFPRFRLTVLGGQLSGSAVGHLRLREVTVSAEAAGFNVEAMLRMFASPDLPLDKLGWVGSVSGSVRARFQVPRATGRDMHDLLIESDLSVVPPAVSAAVPAAVTAVVTPARTVPVSGQGRVVYNEAAERLELAGVVLRTPASSLTADGVLAVGAASRSSLQLSASTTSLGEWMPMISGMRPGKTPEPIELLGRAEFRGALRGSPSAPSLEGRLEAVNFRYDGAPWDRFSGELAWSRDLLRLTGAELRSGESFARFTMTADLDGGGFTDTSPFSLQAQMEGARLENLQKLAATDYPITGIADGSVRVTGTQRNPQGTGVVTFTKGAIVGEPFDSLHAGLNFSQRELRAQDIVLKKGAAQVTGEADYRPADKFFRFQLAGERVPLAEIERLRFRPVALGGLAGFRASGSGTVDRPTVDATVRVTDLLVNGERVGNLTAEVETRNTQLTVSIASQLHQGTARGTLTADLTGDFPAKGRIEFTSVDLDPLLQPGIRGRITTHSSATGSVDLAGPLKKPEALALAAEFSDFRMAIEQTDLRNSGPLRASYRNGAVQIEQAHLIGGQTDMKLSGSVRLTGPQAARVLNLRADGEINMALVRTINPDLVASGQVALTATATGPLDRPLLVGRAEFRDAAIAVADFPTGLSKLQGAVVFDASRLRIEKLTAEAGGGEVSITGAMDYDPTGGPGELRLHADARGVRLRYPEGTSSVLDASLNLTGTTRRGLLSGEVSVGRVRFDRRFDLASALGLARAPAARPAASQLLNNLQLDVRVVSAPDLRFEFIQARNVHLEAGLRVRGTAARPVVLGRVNLLQGEIYFAGTEYIVNRGDISFLNPIAFEPSVNLSLQTRAQQYEITIDFNGKLDAMAVSYRSDPPLPSGDIQALLITGRTREGPFAAQASQALPTIGANTILAQALNATVGSRIERIFGVSRLKIDPQVGGPETNPGARVTLEQQVTPDIRFTYITNLASSQQQVIQVEWTINPRWSVIAVRDRNGLFGIDLKWRKRFH